MLVASPGRQTPLRQARWRRPQEGHAEQTQRRRQGCYNGL